MNNKIIDTIIQQLKKTIKKENKEYYEKAAENNYLHAIYRLGEIYLNGKITYKDLLKAKHYFSEYKKIESDYYVDYYLNKIEKELKKEGKLV